PIKGILVTCGSARPGSDDRVAVVAFDDPGYRARKIRADLQVGRTQYRSMNRVVGENGNRFTRRPLELDHRHGLVRDVIRVATEHPAAAAVWRAAVGVDVRLAGPEADLRRLKSG